jgi:hypothetical protein
MLAEKEVKVGGPLAAGVGLADIIWLLLALKSRNTISRLARSALLQQPAVGRAAIATMAANGMLRE